MCAGGSRIQAHHPELANTPLCDCLVVWREGGRDIAASVELKSGSYDLKHAVEQLQAGADILAEAGRGLDAYGAVLATRGHLRSIDIIELKRQKVLFRGGSYPVLIARCGDELRRVLEEYSHL